MAKWECLICGYIYDPAVGAPEHGVKPGILSRLYLKTGVAHLWGTQGQFVKKE